MVRQRRLLIVSHTAEMGGAEFVLLDIARAFGARCHVLLFADGPLARRLSESAIAYTVIPAGTGLTGVRREAGRLRLLASAPSLLRMVVRVAQIARRYDVLYPNSQKAGMVMMLAALITRRPLVWHMHDILSDEHFANLQRRVAVRLANLAARRVLVVSTAARDAFIRDGGDPQRISVVYNGFDESKFTDDTSIDGDLRRSLGIGDKPVVGAFSRLSPWKGQHVLLHALAKLPHVHAVIVGDVLFAEQDYAAELRSLALELGITDRVHWLGHRDDVPALMKGVDVVLHTSTASEPFGRVIVEGMLAGRPVVATDAGASREVLGDDALAIVPPGDPAGLAACLTALFNLPADGRAQIGQRNRARARALFSLRAMIAGVEQAVALDDAA